ncbi:hypothetical protein RWV98_07515 [Agathobaculum sp. NTUH-O15-33]|uniref:hypothetical protein n=1 Tax=Butyricicoccaceae TaxID=3085642 RepID=UPI0024798033|nr:MULTISPECIES: hypothetical protein [Butyricicoccaceae]WNX86111.1 hypothetical protein RWV98_07515 [Agathobaculum sp. NTUH-O15-33]
MITKITQQELHQIRYYDMTDKLVGKSNATDYKTLVCQMMEQFQDHSVFRAVIRRLDAELNDWLVESSEQNINAIWPVRVHSEIKLWKVTFYDAGDRIITDKTQPWCPHPKENQRDLVRFGALYCVLSNAMEGVSPILAIQSNAAHVLYNGKAHVSHKRSGKLFEQALAEDWAETENLKIEAGRETSEAEKQD